MISNLRAKPIQGFVTDSAGNVLRNSNIVIYRNSPTGLISVDRVESDDEGYFISNPLPNGTYDVFESGIRVSRVIHRPDLNAIQCFKASEDNYFPGDIIPFSSLTEDGSNLNDYKYFLQIEPEDVSVDIFGNLFPIYDLDLSNLVEDAGELYFMKRFLNLLTDSRITIPRFDVEFYLPQTATQSSYKRIKWAGVPGIRFKPDSKIVAPLDYYSIVANNPFVISNNGNDFGASDIEVTSFVDPYLTIDGSESVDAFVSLYNQVGLGDILKLSLDSPANREWYGIIREKSSYSIKLVKWNSSRYTSDTPVLSDAVYSIRAYYGIFQGMASMSSTVSDYFNVVENLNQQNVSSELYTYEN